MYIRLKNVEVENFLGIRKASYDFTNRGLVGVFGPTGVGKSSLFVESLTMGTFGISERYGKSRDEVVNRFIGKDCYIGLNYEVDGDDVFIKTYRKHSKWKNEVFFTVNGKDLRGNGHDQTRDKIMRYLDMDYTAFTNSIVFGQNVAKYFSAMSDADQKTIAERLLGVTWIPRAYELVEDDYSKCMSTLNAEEHNVGKFKTVLAIAESNLKDYINQVEEFKVGIEKQIVQLEQSITETFEQLGDLESEEIGIKIKRFEDDIEGIETRIADKSALMEEEKKHIATISSIKTKITVKREAMKVLQKDIGKKFDFAKDVFCQFCKQNISQLHWEDYVKHIKNDYAGMNREEAELLVEQEVEEGKLDEVLKKLKVVKDGETHKNSYAKEIETLKKQLAETDKETEVKKERMIQWGEQIDELRARPNPFTKLVADKELEIEKVKEEIVEREKVLDLERDNLKYYRFCDEGFSNKGVKSYIIESVIPSMNESARIYSKLFGDKYNISFSPTRELKSGEQKEKFYINVDNRFGSSIYEGNSSGERRTIDVIIMFVLGDLAARRSSKRFSILVLDDVFEKIDESICDSVMQVLRTLTMKPELREEEYKCLPLRESVFVLTHLEYFKNKFENMILVETNNGQTIYRQE